MFVGIIIDHDAHMAQFLGIPPRTVKHQVATAQVGLVVDFLPSILELAEDGALQFIAEMSEHIEGEARTIEDLRTIAAVFVWHSLKCFGILNDTVGK